jgi:hypothetical protein
MMIRIGWLGWSALLAGLLSLSGCGGTKVTEEPRLPDPNVLFINGSPDAGPLDFYVDDVRKAVNIPYPTSNPDFVTIKYKNPAEDEGAFDVDCRPTGGSEDLDRSALPSAQDSDSIVSVIGLRNPGNELDKRLRIVFSSVARRPLTGNRSRIFVIHGMVAGPGDFTPNIDFRTPGENPQILFPNIQYGFDNLGTGDNRVDPVVDAGTFRLQVQRAELDTRTIYAEIDAVLRPGVNYFALVTGVIGDPNPLRRPRIALFEISPRS